MRICWCILQKASLVWCPAPESAHAHVSKPSPSGAGTPPTPAPTPSGGHAHSIANHAHTGVTGAANPPSQGLMHWMSVMAEHMNNPHHDVHYMWNGIEVCLTFF